jgi:ABC-2 type transport system permease protein
MEMLNAIATIAFRDVFKLFRDRSRILASLIFPFVFVGVLGSSLNANLSTDVGYNFLLFVFTGVIGQNLFQSTAAGIISLIEDRQTDFAQEMFIAPVSRYTIIVGKIAGESMVALIQLVGVVVMGFILQVPFDFWQLLRLAPIMLLVCLLGGAFGTMVMSTLSDQKAANQIFPFLLFPQFFLAGVFSPIKNLPAVLWVLSRISPMTYAVDLVRSIYYWGSPEYSRVVLFNPLVNLTVVGAMTVIMIVIGTAVFVRKETDR